MRIAVLVSGGGTNFQALIDRQKSRGLGGGTLALCVSSSETAYALTRAAGAGIPARVLSPKDYETRQAYTDAITALLEAEKIDLVVLCGFLYILSPSFCERFQNAVINIHPSLIPSFCGEGFFGLRVHEAALAYGVKVTGATAHFVTAETDGGPIICQKTVAVLDSDTPQVLQRRVMEQCEWEILPDAVTMFCEGRLSVSGRVVHIR
ncbi:MAG: phosphoribosylglycinamide formyltransferase [Clostridiales bacterium]|nr:MAG: phosphoribosylglycinamide formyltransferase [Clostridiales bacterium]